MHCRISHKLFLSDIPQPILDQVMAELTLDNPKWLENIKMGRSTYKVPRKLKFYSTRTNGGLILPRGYGQRLAQICQGLSQRIVYDDQRRTLPEVDFHFQGTLRDYQESACARMLGRRFGTLCAPTGAGKTVCALYLIAQRQQPTLIIVHTRDLARQWAESIEQFLSIPIQDIGMIGGGRDKIGECITVATVQSVYSRSKILKKHIGHLVVDECHRAPSRTFTTAVTAFDSAYSLGLSATPYRRDGLTQLIFWYLGEMHAKIKTETLMDSGAILRPKIHIVETRFRTKRDQSEEYSQIIADLTEDAERNRLVVDTVASAVQKNAGIALVLSDRKQHCLRLQDMLLTHHGVCSQVFTGDLSWSERKSLVDNIHAGKVRIVFATGQLIGEGFDAQNLTALFLVTPIKFEGRLTQYLGRVLRPAPGKVQPLVYDFADNEVGVLEAACQSRAMVYNKFA